MKNKFIIFKIWGHMSREGSEKNFFFNNYLLQFCKILERDIKISKTERTCNILDRLGSGISAPDNMQ